jgi:putative ABC transport system substrate-binding protein
MSTCLLRREFITGLGGAAAWPLAARAQQQRAMPTIGWLDTRRGVPSRNYVDGFRRGGDRLLGRP